MLLALITVIYKLRTFLLWKYFVSNNNCSYEWIIINPCSGMKNVINVSYTTINNELSSAYYE